MAVAELSYHIAMGYRFGVWFGEAELGVQAGLVAREHGEVSSIGDAADQGWYLCHNPQTRHLSPVSRLASRGDGAFVQLELPRSRPERVARLYVIHRSGCVLRHSIWFRVRRGHTSGRPRLSGVLSLFELIADRAGGGQGGGHCGCDDYAQG